jgi:hypothetical protein
MSAVLAWRRERLSVPLFGMLAIYLGIAAAGTLGRMRGHAWVGLVLQVLSAWWMVAAFRIWDDIADRSIDAVKSPDRVLVGVTDLRPFWILSLVLLGLGAVGALILTGWPGVGLVLMTAICFGGLYRLELGYRQHWVLAKYPLIVAALGAVNWTTLALVYLSFCIYERIDDPGLRQAPGAWLRLIPYLLLVGAVSAVALWDSWLWVPLWALTAGLSTFAITHRRPLFAPLFFGFSLFVIQGVVHV